SEPGRAQAGMEFTGADLGGQGTQNRLVAVSLVAAALRVVIDETGRRHENDRVRVLYAQILEVHRFVSRHFLAPTDKSWVQAGEYDAALLARRDADPDVGQVRTRGRRSKHQRVEAAPTAHGVSVDRREQGARDERAIPPRYPCFEERGTNADDRKEA